MLNRHRHYFGSSIKLLDEVLVDRVADPHLIFQSASLNVFFSFLKIGNVKKNNFEVFRVISSKFGVKFEH